MSSIITQHSNFMKSLDSFLRDQRTSMKIIYLMFKISTFCFYVGANCVKNSSNPDATKDQKIVIQRNPRLLINIIYIQRQRNVVNNF